MGQEHIELTEFGSTMILCALGLSYEQIEELGRKDDDEVLDELLDVSS